MSKLQKILLFLSIMALVSSCNFAKAKKIEKNNMKKTQDKDTQMKNDKKEIEQEFYLIDVKYYSPFGYNRRLQKPDPPVIEGCDQEYIGKITFYKDDSLKLNFLNKNREDSWYKMWEINKEYIKNSKLEKSSMSFHEYLTNYLKNDLNTMPYRTIKKEMGEKYLKNKWTKARGAELINAIEYQDEFPFTFYGVDGDKSKCPIIPKGKKAPFVSYSSD